MTSKFLEHYLICGTYTMWIRHCPVGIRYYNSVNRLMPNMIDFDFVLRERIAETESSFILNEVLQRIETDPEFQDAGTGR